MVRYVLYFAALGLINAPGWVWAKIRGKPFRPGGGPQ